MHAEPRQPKVPSKSKVIRALQRAGINQASRSRHGFQVYGSDSVVLVSYDGLPKGDPAHATKYAEMRTALVRAGYSVLDNGTSLTVRSR